MRPELESAARLLEEAWKVIADSQDWEARRGWRVKAEAWRVKWQHWMEGERHTPVHYRGRKPARKRRRVPA
jgi:hypothetical protein